jgi:hypothetical protein
MRPKGKGHSWERGDSLGGRRSRRPPRLLRIVSCCRRFALSRGVRSATHEQLLGCERDRVYLGCAAIAWLLARIRPIKRAILLRSTL